MGDIHSEVSMTSVLIQAKKSRRRLFNMGYNYSQEKRKFDAEWRKKEAWYRESGMSEEAIQEIFAYDWAEFNTTRRFYRYLEDVDMERIPEKSCDILEAALSKEWIELLDSPETVRKIRKLPVDYIEIIEMLYFEKLTQREIAERMSCSQQNIAKKIEKIKKVLK